MTDGYITSLQFLFVYPSCNRLNILIFFIVSLLESRDCFFFFISERFKTHSSLRREFMRVVDVSFFFFVLYRGRIVKWRCVFHQWKIHLELNALRLFPFIFAYGCELRIKKKNRLNIKKKKKNRDESLDPEQLLT